MGKKPTSGPLHPRKKTSSDPDAWKSTRHEQAPKPPSIPGRVPDGKAVGLDNTTRAALNTAKAVIRFISGK